MLIQTWISVFFLEPCPSFRFLYCRFLSPVSSAKFPSIYSLLHALLNFTEPTRFFAAYFVCVSFASCERRDYLSKYEAEFSSFATQ